MSDDDSAGDFEEDAHFEPGSDGEAGDEVEDNSDSDGPDGSDSESTVAETRTGDPGSELGRAMLAAEDPQSAVPGAAALDHPRVRRIIIVRPEDRVTSARLTQAEETAAIAYRAAQIERGANVFVDIPPNTTSEDIARLELAQRKNPLKIRRPVGKTSRGEKVVEEWAVREMAPAPPV
jgi:DNA-directed RNA polymerase subunit K/omega